MRRRLDGFRRPASQPPSRRVTRALGVVGLLAMLAAAYVGWAAPNGIPGTPHYSLRVEFADAGTLGEHSEIRLGGTHVGQVLHVRVDGGVAVAELQLDPAIRPLRSGTRIRVRPRGALGASFVEVTPSAHGTPLADGAAIPAADTSTGQQTDAILGTFDARTRTRARQMLGELGLAFAGRGVYVNRVLAEGPAYLGHLDAVARAVNDRPASVTRLVQNSEELLGALDPVREDMAAAYADGSRALRPFALEAPSWRATLQVMAPTLDEARVTLGRADDLIAATGSLADETRVTLRPAPAALHDLAATLRAAPRPLARLRPSLALVRRVTPATLTLLVRLRGVLPGTDRFAEFGGQLLAVLGARVCDLGRLVDGAAEAHAYGNDVTSYELGKLVGQAPGAELRGASQPTAGRSISPYPKPGPCLPRLGPAP